MIEAEKLRNFHKIFSKGGELLGQDSAFLTPHLAQDGYNEVVPDTVWLSPQSQLHNEFLVICAL